MIYSLPTSINVQGTEYEVRSDYRAVLDICTALLDPELSSEEKALAALDIFYFSPSFSEMPQEHYQEALEKCFWFINCGNEENGRKSPRLMDWEQDFPMICAPINRVCGKDIRGIPYDEKTNTGGLHWWSFISAYYEIGGDCTFAQIVNIRDKLARGKSLDKSEREWYRQNRNLVDFKRKYTDSDNEIIKQWIGKAAPI